MAETCTARKETRATVAAVSFIVRCLNGLYDWSISSRWGIKARPARVLYLLNPAVLMTTGIWFALLLLFELLMETREYHCAGCGTRSTYEGFAVLILCDNQIWTRWTGRLVAMKTYSECQWVTARCPAWGPAGHVLCLAQGDHLASACIPLYVFSSAASPTSFEFFDPVSLNVRIRCLEHLPLIHCTFVCQSTNLYASGCVCVCVCEILFVTPRSRDVATVRQP